GAPATCRQGTVKHLPIVVDLPGGQGRVWVRAQGLLDGTETLVGEARAEVPVEGTVDAIIGLTQACLGVRCAYGQTCVKGRCEVTQFGGNPESCEAEIPPDAPKPGLPLCKEQTP
ncbi:MAG: hypothetical protein D6729_00340, partial [Deltaproteobacteria bacterium]